MCKSGNKRIKSNGNTTSQSLVSICSSVQEVIQAKYTDLENFQWYIELVNPQVNLKKCVYLERYSH